MTRLTGLFPLSYRGVNAVSPPNFTYQTRAPLPTDSKNFYIGDIWLQRNIKVNPHVYEPWMLVDLANDVATWINFGVGSGELESLTGDTGGAVFGDINQNIDIVSGMIGLSVDGNPGINTLVINNSSGNPLFQTLEGDTGGPVPPDGTGNIHLISGSANFSFDGNPGTNAITLNVIGGGNIQTLTGDLFGPIGPDGAGNIDILTGLAIEQSGATVFFAGSVLGHQLVLNVTDAKGNTLIGLESGNASLSGFNSTGLGDSSLKALTTGGFNTFVGASSGLFLKDGANNCGFGQASLSGVESGNNNIAIGSSSGGNYFAGDSNNIVINNKGVGGENGAIRIGDILTAQTCFIQGIAGVTVSNQLNVIIDSTTGQLGTEVSSNNVAFQVGLTAVVDNVIGANALPGYKVIWNNKDFDIGNNFNTATGEFIAPVTGIYFFQCCIGARNVGSAMINTDFMWTVNGIQLFLNNNINPVPIRDNTAGFQEVDFKSAIHLSLSVGDAVSTYFSLQGGAGNTAGITGGAQAFGQRTWFGGHLVAQT